MTEAEIEELRAEIARLKAVADQKTDAYHVAKYELWRAENEWRDATNALGFAAMRLNYELNR